MTSFTFGNNLEGIFPSTPRHNHSWFKAMSMKDPPVDVYDCECGKRRRVIRGAGLRPDEVDDDYVKPGGSATNALIIMDGPQEFSSLHLLTAKQGTP